MKKFIIAFIIVAFAITGMVLQAEEACCSKKGQETGFKSYIATQEALAADNFEGAKKAMAVLAGNCQEECGKELGVTANKAKDIKELRVAFKTISTKLASKGKVPAGFGTAFCSMAFNNKGAYWIQKKGTIANPYYGAKMLTCGKFKEFKVAKKDGHGHDHDHKGHGHKH